MLRLSYGHYKVVEGHALAAYPQECCGLILGWFHGDGDRQATEIWPVANAWTLGIEAEHQQILDGSENGALSVQASIDMDETDCPCPSAQNHSQRDRFSIDPRDLLKAQKYARSQSWQIIGIYHSHPDHVAAPSERDRQSAWPQYSYLILSVYPDRVTDCKSWRLNDHSQFEAEPWQL